MLRIMTMKDFLTASAPQTSNTKGFMERSWNQRGVHAIKAKLTVEDLIEIRRLWALGKYRQIVLARMFNVGKSTIGRAVRRERCD